MFSFPQFGNMEGITTAVLDEFPQLRTNALHKSLFLGALCFSFYLMGLLLVTNVSVLKHQSVATDVFCVCAVQLTFSAVCLHREAFTGSRSLTRSAQVLASS